MRVLVVDDSPAMRRYVARTLEMTGIGMQIDHASNGMEAIEKARTAPPSIIITDLNMPGMSGEELMERASNDERLREIPFLVLAADVRAHASERSACGQPVDWLMKPVAPEVLRSTLLQILEKTALESAVRGAVQFTFETMFYAEVRYCGAGGIRIPATGAVVDFTGPVSGAAHIFVEEERASRLAADFLAVDSIAVDAAMRSHMACELANILCARVLSRWMPDGVFRYSLPVSAAEPARMLHAYRFCAPGAEPDFALDLFIRK